MSMVKCRDREFEFICQLVDGQINIREKLFGLLGPFRQGRRLHSNDYVPWHSVFASAYQEYMKHTLTRPLRTSMSASHCKSSGYSPKPSQSPASALLQYASCLSLIFRAVS